MDIQEWHRLTDSITFFMEQKQNLERALEVMNRLLENAMSRAASVLYDFDVKE